MFAIMHRRDDWKPGKIVKRVAPLSFHIDLGNGRIIRCHVDQIRKNLLMSPIISESQDDSEAVGPEHVMEEIPVNVDFPDANGAEELEPSSQEPRYPSRMSHPPDRFSG